MGVLIQDEVATPQGLLLANVYASFNTNPVYIVQDDEARFSIRSTACFYYSYDARHSGKQPLFAESVAVQAAPSPDAPYAALYEALRANYQGVLDVLTQPDK